jgi:flagellar biosynthesis GTPase FlhF
MEKLDMDTTLEQDTDTKTFRGRSLEQLLPKIRAELGPDAIVLRRSEGLAGGVGGFFQKSYVEVEARAALPTEVSLEARNDRATAEGLASPAIQALVDQAAPFADALASAQTEVGERAHEVLIAAATASAPDAGLYGPQPNRAAIEETAGHYVSAYEPEPIEEDLAGPAFDDLGADRPAAADAAEKRLVAAGLSATLASDIVREAIAHGLPFAQPRALKKLIRTALARRMPVMADLGGDARTVAFIGPGGAGKTSAVEKLATAYARADADVVIVALRSNDAGSGLATRLEPLGVTVVAVDDAQQAARRIARRSAPLMIVDTPAAGLGNRDAVERIAGDLRALGVTEVHLALPATLSAAAADELAAALAPLGITHVALTHADQTARPGAPVELAISGRRALSYVCTREEIAPVDPDELAKQLLP